MFCFWCTLFVPEGAHFSEANWTKIGVNNWKKGVENIRHHENTVHKTAAFQYSCFISGNDIEHSLSESAKLAEKERREQVEKNRKLTNILSKTLQTDNVDLAECFQLVDFCITNLKELRKEQEFETFIDEASNIAIECGISDEFTEKRPRKKKRFFDELATIDVIITQLNERFDQSRRILFAFTCLSPDNRLNRSKNDNESSLDILLEEYGSAGLTDVSTNDAIAEYTLFQTRFKERLKERFKETKVLK
ncbi:Hypothetical predicted protein [Paramuricea clavata]|uniref:Uncharacterized protein n=1 Tax=Paramuricea clavata TaxID=317549 RepID=A0A7D9HY37_PARCT|nr:Hypothetical predicted protein [Paramuricea clavata]